MAKKILNPADVVDVDEAHPPAEKSQFEKLADELEAKPVKTMRCYAVSHGLKIMVRPEKYQTVRDEHGKAQEKLCLDQGYTMHFQNHRCDVPMEPLPAEDGVRLEQKESELSLALKKRAKFFSFEWKTAEELARIIDQPSCPFISEMYRLSDACGMVCSDRSKKNFMSEAKFEKIIRMELVELGYLKRAQPAPATVAE